MIRQVVENYIHSDDRPIFFHFEYQESDSRFILVSKEDAFAVVLGRINELKRMMTEQEMAAMSTNTQSE